MRALTAGCLLAAASLPLLPNRFEAHCPRVRHAPRAAILQDVAPPPAFVEALDAERAAEIWARRPAGTLPNADRQAELIEWLKMGPLAHDPDRLLYTCLRNEPRLLKRASSLPALRETHAALVALLREDLSPKRLAVHIASEPGLLLRRASELLASAQNLATVTGLREDMLTRVLREAPGLLLCEAGVIDERLQWLRDRLHIEPGGRLMRVLTRAPLVLLLSRSTLTARLDCLLDLGVPEEQLGPLVVRTPRLLHSPREELRAKTQWLRQSGVVPDAPPEALGAFLRRQPDYYAISSKTCDDTFAWLRSVGLDETQAARVLREEPAILTMPIEQLQLRASFFVRVIGGSPAELVAVPHMLICDLGKVPMLRHAYCLTQGIDVKPIQLLVKGDATFCTEVAGCDIEEFNAFEADGKHLAFFQGAGI